MTLVLDSAGVSVLAASRGRLAELPLRCGWPAVVPSVVLTECLTGDHRRDHAANLFLVTCRILDVEEPHARAAARLRTSSGRAASISAVDAVVVAMAATQPEPVVVTGDPRDIAALAAHTARHVTISAV